MRNERELVGAGARGAAARLTELSMRQAELSREVSGLRARLAVLHQRVDALRRATVAA
jgi:hypothetical protein